MKFKMNFNKQDIAYLRCAFVMSELSKSVRKKVGSLLVSYDNPIPVILSEGVNGTDPGNSNLCEDPETGITLPSVIHAEHNCLKKIENSPISFQKGVLYVTFNPCPSCCSMIINWNQKHPDKKIIKVVFCFGYKDQSGIEKLEESGIEVMSIPIQHLEWDLTLKSEMKYNMSGVLRDLGHSEESINDSVKLLLIGRR